MIVPPGEGSKSYPRVRTGLRGRHRGAYRARRSRGCARRRRHRRSRRLRRGGGAARPRLRAGADHAAGPGRFLGRRQDRDQFRPRQESDRRLPSADPGARRHRRCSTRCRRANFAPAMPKSPNTACSATRAFFAWLETNWREVFAAAEPAREHAIARMLPRQGRQSSPATSAKPAIGAAQSRPHFRSRARGGMRLFRPAAARRGRCRRHGAGVRLFGAARSVAGRRGRRAPSAIWPRSGCRRGRRTFRARCRASTD